MTQPSKDPTDKPAGVLPQAPNTPADAPTMDYMDKNTNGANAADADIRTAQGWGQGGTGNVQAEPLPTVGDDGQILGAGDARPTDLPPVDPAYAGEDNTPPNGFRANDGDVAKDPSYDEDGKPVDGDRRWAHRVPADGAQVPNDGAVDEASLNDRKAALDKREEELDDREHRLDKDIPDLNDAYLKQRVVSEFSLRAWDAFKDQPNITPEAERALKSLTLCVLVLRNGAVVTGMSSSDSPEAYHHQDGLKAARDRAMDKLIEREDYALRNRRMGI